METLNPNLADRVPRVMGAPTGDADPTTSQLERQRVLGTLKAKRAGRNHAEVDVEAATDHKPSSDSAHASRHARARYADAEGSEQPEDVGCSDSMRASRRARIETMRARCAERGQAAQESSVPLNELVDAANSLQDPQGKASHASGAAGRSALQRRMDHIRLSRATRREEIQQLQEQEVRQVETKGHAGCEEHHHDHGHSQPRPPSLQSVLLGESKVAGLADIKVLKPKPRPPPICTDFEHQRSEGQMQEEPHAECVDAMPVVDRLPPEPRRGCKQPCASPEVKDAMPLALPLTSGADMLPSQAEVRAMAHPPSNIESVDSVEVHVSADTMPAALSASPLLQHIFEDTSADVVTKHAPFSTSVAECDDCSQKQTDYHQSVVGPNEESSSGQPPGPVLQAFEQLQSLEGAPDMNRVSKVSANRRATLEKLKEKRAERSRLALIESNQLDEDDDHEATISQKCKGSGAKLHNQQECEEGKKESSVKMDNTVPEEVERRQACSANLMNHRDSNTGVCNSNFQEDQSHSALNGYNTNNCIRGSSVSAFAEFNSLQPLSAHDAASGEDASWSPSKFLPRDAKPDLHAARLKRIRELQNARGAPPMPDVKVGKLGNLCSEQNVPHLEQEPWVGADALNAEIDCNDYILPFKKIVLSDQGYSRSVSVVEPEPEIQDTCLESAHHPRPDSTAKPAKLCPLQIRTDVPREEVQDIKRRFKNFCREADDDGRTYNHSDRVFEELQGKWRDLRGGMDASDLRPQFKALLAPLDVRVDFSYRPPELQPSGTLCLNAKELPKLANEDPPSRLYASPRRKSAALVPYSPQAAGAVVSLPSLRQKLQQTPNRLPKAQQPETCVHQ